MGTMNIAGASYSDIISGCHVAGTYYQIEPMGTGPVEGAANYEESHVTYPGVNGMGIKRFGFRGRIITVEMCFLGLTKTACETAKNAFNTSITGLASFAIQVPGGTARSFCRLQSCQPIGWRQWGVDKLMLCVKYDFLQVRENT